VRQGSNRIEGKKENYEKEKGEKGKLKHGTRRTECGIKGLII
jgi:hypothetical protein